MRLIGVPIWKSAPFIRLLFPVIIGILLEWYLQFEFTLILFSGGCFIAGIFFFRFLPLSLQFRLQAIRGVQISLVFIVLGAALGYHKDIRNQNNWFGNFYHDSDYLVAKINEPLIEKTKSYKADVLIEDVIENDSGIHTSGKVTLYFEKDSSLKNIKYGDKLLINKSLQHIKNSGNPGAFNYERYSAFQQIFHTAYLKKSDWVLLKDKDVNPFNQFIFSTRQKVINVLQKNMNGNDDELSIAEALLIGYKQDLDKDLVQAYSNTGVVHIIAISGLHLGLIYAMLIWIFNKIPFIKKSNTTKVILVLSGLWLFALLTGGSASVLRSAVMFSGIVIGKNYFKQASTYNSLAASAFILLCYNPFFLWDVGFQLSYLAILGIVTLQKPVSGLLYIRNKWINKIWQLSSVSISAQIFTFPICLFYFHQFPNTFLFTNLIMIPLAFCVLFVEILLIAFSWIPIAAYGLGKLVWSLVWIMNNVILFFNKLPFSLWDRISASISSTILLYIFIFSIAFWLLNKNKTAFRFSLVILLAFTLITVYNKWTISKQQKLIVYNVAQHQAIDFINGHDYRFTGDSILLIDGVLQNFHLKPGRIALQLNNRYAELPSLYNSNNFYFFSGKRILLIDSSISFAPLQHKIEIDVGIISKNAKVNIPKLLETFTFRKIVFDASNSLWKIDKWEKDCEQLNLPFYSIPRQGAFIMNL